MSGSRPRPSTARSGRTRSGSSGRSRCSRARWSSRVPPRSRVRKATNSGAHLLGSTYGFQKLACEYFARGAAEQYKLPYTIVRPLNWSESARVELGAIEKILSGNIKLAMSHVVPDLVQKLVKGQDPLRILGSGNQIRHYTYGGDLARGIRVCMESPAALNEDFNLSTAESTTVLELAEAIWKKLRPGEPFRWISDQAFSTTSRSESRM